jgi:phage terminase large subunit-like protein
MVSIVTDRDASDLGGVLLGHSEPRIHSPLVNLPSKGLELIDFSKSIGLDLMPWQSWLAVEAHRVKPDGRWHYPVICAVVARQNGKSTLMMSRILAGLFLWNDPLQIGSAHRLTTSLETFRALVGIIESNEVLSSQVKRIRWAHGSEEIETNHQTRYMVKAANAAARGISKPETVFMDELREHKDQEAWASMKYTMMAASNPQVWTLSTAGDQHSLILNQLRERGLASVAGSSDDIGYFEWSAPKDDINDVEGWRYANPSLGRTIHIDNIRSATNDAPDVFRTEVLCRWVDSINPAIPSLEWASCENKTEKLDDGRRTWLGIDLSPDRRHGALVGAQRLDSDRFIVQLLHTWHNPVSLDDKAIANDIAPYARKFNTELVAYSKRTSSAVAMRLAPAGIHVMDIDGPEYAQSCDELLGAVTSGRLVHNGQAELTKQVLSASRLPYGDGAWVIGRRASKAAVCATVASALVTHYATRPETEFDILVG